MNILSTTQVKDIANILVEECGPSLTGGELSDQIGLLLEDISGFETASDSDIHQVITEIERYYHDTCKHLEEN